MARISLNDVDVPISAFEVVRLSSKLEVSGVLFPMRQGIPPALVDATGESLILIPLEGDRAFERMDIRIGTIVEGVLFREPKLAVNVLSRVNPNAGGQLGDVSLMYGRVHVLTSDGRFGSRDPEPFPLQMKAPATAENPIGFRQWSLLIDHGNDEIELWRNFGNAPATRDDEEE